MKEKLITTIKPSSYILFFMAFHFFTTYSQSFINRGAGTFLSLDWKTGYFHLYDNTLFPWAFSGTYTKSEDTIFCNPTLSIIDTSACKYDYDIGGASIRRFVFIKRDDILKSITAKYNGYDFKYEMFDSLYFVDDHNEWLWREVYKEKEFQPFYDRKKTTP